MTARLTAVVIALVAACREAPVEPCPSLRVAGIAAERAAPAARATPFDSAFAAAGAEFHVPPALLKAIGWVETRWEMVQGAEEFAGRAPAFGVMALRGTALERGAARAAVTPEAARRDPLANIRAAAALLDAIADEAAIDRSRIEPWSGVLARYSETERPDGRAAGSCGGCARATGRGTSRRRTTVHSIVGTTAGSTESRATISLRGSSTRGSPHKAPSPPPRSRRPPRSPAT